jgi:hypothetical protein
MMEKFDTFVKWGIGFVEVFNDVQKEIFSKDVNKEGGDHM